MKPVQFVTLLLFSLVTGVFWGTWFSLSRSMAAITPGIPLFTESDEAWQLASDPGSRGTSRLPH